MKLKDYFELFFFVSSAMAMPFIVIGNYFSLISCKDRDAVESIFFLIITIIYAAAYTYFSYKMIIGSELVKKIRN